MSRVGSTPITLPDGVEVAIDGATVSVKGPKGELSRSMADGITTALDDGVVTVDRTDDERRTRALHGLSRTLIYNMVVGVTEGYRKELEIVGVGYRANLQGCDKLELALGFSHPVKVDAPDGITFEVPQPTRVDVVGIDKEVVGQVAADLRALRKPEPYKGKGVRYLGEHIQRKAGKAAATA
jgi:large subunit ribosomal protein L6